MKKHILAIWLVLLMIPGLLAFGAFGDEADLYLRLKALCLAHLPQDPGGSAATLAWLDPEQKTPWQLCWDGETLSICVKAEDLTLTLPLSEDPPETYHLRADWQKGVGHIDLDPAAYTPDTDLFFVETQEDAETILAEIRTLLPDLIEMTGVVTSDPDAPKALGFAAFERHTMHVYDEGTVTLPPTCAEEGFRVLVCKVCGAGLEQPIPPTGEHTWSGVVTQAPTCEKTGLRTDTCTVCGLTQTQTLPAYGHAWKISQVKISHCETCHGTAAYVCARCSKQKDAALCAGEVFTDMPGADHWAHGGIDWAYLRGVTLGTTESTFSPEEACTRAQVVTFLWRAAGSPKPKSSGTPFADVAKADYFYQPVQWAVQNGITAGTGKTTFSPNDPCTRAQVVTFLWRAAGEPKAAQSSRFADVPHWEYYAKAVAWAVGLGVTAGTDKTTFSPEQICTRAQIVTFLHRDSKHQRPNTPWIQSYALYFGQTALQSRAMCKGNRTYISQAELKRTFGASIATDHLRWPVVRDGEERYVALADAAEALNLCAIYREEDCSVHLYRKGKAPWGKLTAQAGSKPAYLRLEDVMADYGVNGRFTHESLMKLRFFGDFLQDQTDGFYIAWIPLYVNPPKGIENDISTQFNFYNADFVFTLDSLLTDGGRIGLHGLTHQDHDSVSSVGYEFGPKNDLTQAQIEARFQRAKRIASDLGYKWSFFEFPHYATTPLQRQVADRHFDVIYQQDPDAKIQGQIETHQVGDHTCRWVPTPADYVDGRSDLSGILGRLRTSHEKKQVMSLFFHPAVDTYYLELHFDGQTASCTYDQSANVMPNVVRLIRQLGYHFGLF